MPVVSHIILCTSKSVDRVDFIFSVLLKKKTKQKKNKQIKQKTPKRNRKLGEVLGMSIILIALMVSGLFVYVQTHQIEHTKPVQCSFCISFIPQSSC